MISFGHITYLYINLDEFIEGIDSYNYWVLGRGISRLSCILKVICQSLQNSNLAVLERKK